MEFFAAVDATLDKRWTNRRFRALFGVSVTTAFVVWTYLSQISVYSFKPHHLLWTLYMLKTGNRAEVGAHTFNCDPHTLLTWMWRVIGTLYSTLHTVMFQFVKIINNFF